MSVLTRLAKSVQGFANILSKDGFKDRMKGLSPRQKTGFSVVTCVTLGLGIAEWSEKVSTFRIGWEIISRWYKKMTEERDRRKMIENGVAHGLAWIHYFGYLKYVLKDFENTVNECEWYGKLSNEEKTRMSKKLYELIPRKCYVDIPGSDYNIKQVSDLSIEIDSERVITIPIYSIKDGNTEYFCMCECPHSLKTINNVNDIQMAGISRSIYSDLISPWIGNSPVQLFTIDTKLIQLMKFYYTMNSIFCMQINDENLGKNARLLLFNEETEKLSNVLLRAIKEDLQGSNSNLEQKPHGSLMANKLLTAEERKDIFYEYDVFVTHSAEVHDTKAVDNMNAALQSRNMNILSEKKCIGKDWLTKLKYAATKCRWIVFLDSKTSKNKMFTSSKLVESLKSILESRKVQTIAIVGKRDELFIHDDLRCVNCISYNDDDTDLNDTMDTLYKTMSGFEVNLGNLQDYYYYKPGEVAVGLAWNFAANNLSKILPDLHNEAIEHKRTAAKKDRWCPKFLIFIPESCKTSKYLRDEVDQIDAYLESSPGYSKSYNLVKYSWYLDKQETKEEFFHGQYARQVEVIRQMKEANLLNEEQMKSELNNFTTTVDKIMEILHPEEIENYAFLFYNDEKNKKKTIDDVLLERFMIENFTYVCERASTMVENI